MTDQDFELAKGTLRELIAIRRDNRNLKRQMSLLEEQNRQLRLQLEVSDVDLTLYRIAGGE